MVNQTPLIPHERPVSAILVTVEPVILRTFLPSSRYLFDATQRISPIPDDKSFVPQMSFRGSVVPLSRFCHKMPSKCAIAPARPTAYKSELEAPQIPSAV